MAFSDRVALVGRQSDLLALAHRIRNENVTAKNAKGLHSCERNPLNFGSPT
jgi:hypothetical protein